MRQCIIIDAGSTGSRVHVYEGVPVREGLPRMSHPHPQLKQEPGLGVFSGQPHEAGPSLLPLITFAASQVRERTSDTQPPSVPLQLALSTPAFCLVLA